MAGHRSRGHRVACAGHDQPDRPAFPGRLARHHLQQERLSRPFRTSVGGRGGTDASRRRSRIAALRRAVPHSVGRWRCRCRIGRSPRWRSVDSQEKKVGNGSARSRRSSTELPDYRNGPYADLRKWLLSEIEDTRVRSSAVHRDSIAVRREGAAQIALVGPPNVGKSSLLQALSEIQIKTGDYPFTTLRPVPALTRIGGVLVQLVEIPGLIGGASDDRGGGRALLGVLRTADAIVYCARAGADPGGAGDCHRRGGSGRHRQAGRPCRDPRRRGRSRGDRARFARAFPTLPVVAVSILDERSLDAFREAVWALTGLIRVRLRHDGVVDEEPLALDPGSTVEDVADCGPPRPRRELHRRPGLGNIGPIRRPARRSDTRGRRWRRRGDPHVNDTRDDPIVRFYRGEGRDGAGRTIEEVWALLGRAAGAHPRLHPVALPAPRPKRLRRLERRR